MSKTFESTEARTRAWLDSRFQMRDSMGVYFAHQPIYGFRRGPCEPGHFGKYVRTYRLIKELHGEAFETLLDAGAAEGYKAYVAKELLGARPIVSDISSEACRRACGIFGLQSVAADVRQMPFTDESFDVVICSETLEHVPNFQLGLQELLRVSRSIVLVTVPREKPAVVAHNVAASTVHGHINRFDEHSLDYLRPLGYSVEAVRMRSPLLKGLGVILEKPDARNASQYPKGMFRAHQLFAGVLHRLFGVRTMAALLRLDGVLARHFGGYEAILFIVRKTAKRPSGRMNLDPVDLINVRVELFRLSADEAGRGT